MRSAAIVLALLGPVVFGPAARAFDRIAVERLDGESAWDAAVAFEQACFRTGAAGAGARPVQTFEIDGRPFVRLRAGGLPHPPRCLAALEDGRRGVDGSITWFDGFSGGLVIPDDDGRRIADAEWYDPAAKLQAPPVDAELLARLARADAEALKSFASFELPAAFTHFDALLRREDGDISVAIETIARTHPHWRIRRMALGRLNFAASFEALLEAARQDESWEVRQAAVALLGRLADRPPAERDGLAEAAERTAVEVLASDASTPVKLAAAAHFPPGRAASFRNHFRRVAREDGAPDVRAAVLEVLARAGEMSRSEAREALADEAAPVRALGAAVLSQLMKAEDAPLLWQAMHDEDRLVRLAAGGLVERIDDGGISGELWELYLQEAQQVDSQPEYLQLLLEAIGRRSFEGLGEQAAARLNETLAPAERRHLAMLLARVAPELALQSLIADLDADDRARRVAAVYAAPDSAMLRQKRLSLLGDEDPDVRAAAAIALCRTAGFDAIEQVRTTDLVQSPLGFEAAQMLSRCGRAVKEPARLATDLLGGGGPLAPGRAGSMPWVAIAAMALLLGSVVITKLRQPPDPS